jgi:hypothetical protein
VNILKAKKFLLFAFHKDELSLRVCADDSRVCCSSLRILRDLLRWLARLLALRHRLSKARFATSYVASHNHNVPESVATVTLTPVSMICCRFRLVSGDAGVYNAANPYGTA